MCWQNTKNIMRILCVHSELHVLAAPGGEINNQPIDWGPTINGSGNVS